MHAEASERSLSTAWRLGQLGQLGLQLLEMGEDEQEEGDEPAPGNANWEQLLEATHGPPVPASSHHNPPPNLELEIGESD